MLCAFQSVRAAAAAAAGVAAPSPSLTSALGLYLEWPDETSSSIRITAGLRQPAGIYIWLLVDFAQLKLFFYIFKQIFKTCATLVAQILFTET